MTSRSLRTAALLAGGLLLVVAFELHYRFFDMAVYQGAVRWWMGGGDLYAWVAPVDGLLGFTYPPFGALVLVPASLLPLEVAGWLTVAAGLLALGVSLRALGVRPQLILVLLVVTEPVRQTFGMGQVNLLLLALVVVDLTVVSRRFPRWTGIGVGLATAIKLTPGLFIVYLLVTRRWRAAAVAAATTAAVTFGTLLIAPRETLVYFGDLLWQTGRVGEPAAVANQSLAGLLARLTEAQTTPREWWVLLCAAALGLGLHRAAQAHAYGDEGAALAIVGLTAALVTPIAWTHHLVFLPIAVVVLARADRSAAAACLALSVLSPIWWVDDPAAGPLSFLAANTFVLLAALLVWRLPIGRVPVWRGYRRGTRPHGEADDEVVLWPVGGGGRAADSPDRVHLRVRSGLPATGGVRTRRRRGERGAQGRRTVLDSEVSRDQ